MQGNISPADCDLDGLYDYNLRCLWTITGTFYLEVKLYIHDLDIQVANDCVLDSLKVNKQTYITNQLSNNVDAITQLFINCELTLFKWCFWQSIFKFSIYEFT